MEPDKRRVILANLTVCCLTEKISSQDIKNDKFIKFKRKKHCFNHEIKHLVKCTQVKKSTR